LAPVSSGAELIADGCIHIYGALRGRAIAGATGNPNARIFCKRLEADLVAIAGVYMVADQIPKQLLGKSVQVKLGEDGNINIELLE
ncbi:MAG: septum site-determining protein MinC, partial [Pseudomonadales bacterium]|nr:septum site-determining protein MinC [Pseudomonadales bacterium]